MFREERRMKENVCPICKYEFKHCQCAYGGKAHPNRSVRASVVFEHIYLLSGISYSDEEKEKIVKELERKEE